MSANRIMQGSFSTAGQLGFGYFSFGSAGLITGLICGWLIATFSALRFYNYRTIFANLSSIIAKAKLYKDYPILSAPASLLDSASVQTPVFFLTLCSSESPVVENIWCGSNRLYPLPEHQDSPYCFLLSNWLTKAFNSSICFCWFSMIACCSCTAFTSGTTNSEYLRL